jgi:hypothetical protein
MRSPAQSSEGLRRDSVPLPVPKGVDPQWQEKIARARQARDLMAKLREGKPKSFRRAVGTAN